MLAPHSVAKLRKKERDRGGAGGAMAWRRSDLALRAPLFSWGGRGNRHPPLEAKKRRKKSGGSRVLDLLLNRGRRLGGKAGERNRTKSRMNQSNSLLAVWGRAEQTCAGLQNRMMRAKQPVALFACVMCAHSPLPHPPRKPDAVERCLCLFQGRLAHGQPRGRAGDVLPHRHGGILALHHLSGVLANFTRLRYVGGGGTHARQAFGFEG